MAISFLNTSNVDVPSFIKTSKCVRVCFFLDGTKPTEEETKKTDAIRRNLFHPREEITLSNIATQDMKPSDVLKVARIQGLGTRHMQTKVRGLNYEKRKQSHMETVRQPSKRFKQTNLLDTLVNENIGCCVLCKAFRGEYDFTCEQCFVRYHSACLMEILGVPHYANPKCPNCLAPHEVDSSA